MMENDLSWYIFTNISGIGRRTRTELLNVFSTPEAILNASKDELKKYLKETQISALKSVNENKKKEEFLNLQKSGIAFVHINHQNYPKELLKIPDPPHSLYIKGNMKQYCTEEIVAVSVIGSRNCSGYGYDMAYKIGYELGANNIAVISGMARGIDGAAQRGCIDAGYYTYGVLGCGINICYPKENIELYMNIQKNGMIISEYPPDTPPHRGLFPERNRIISGLGSQLVVVEAGKKSGTFITVEMALEQGKDVYALPGRIIDEKSKGCNMLIKEGAYIFDNVYDIIDSLKSKNILKNSTKKSENINISLASTEKKVYAILDFEPKHINYIIERTGLDIETVMCTLITLEMKHLVKQSTGNYYAVDM